MQNITIPENMEHIFKYATYTISQSDFDLLNEKHAHAKKLSKNNGVHYPGIIESTVFWLVKAYTRQIPVNKKVFQETIEALCNIKQKNQYDM